MGTQQSQQSQQRNHPKFHYEIESAFPIEFERKDINAIYGYCVTSSGQRSCIIFALHPESEIHQAICQVFGSHETFKNTVADEVMNKKVKNHTLMLCINQVSQRLYLKWIAAPSLSSIKERTTKENDERWEHWEKYGIWQRPRSLSSYKRDEEFTLMILTFDGGRVMIDKSLEQWAYLEYMKKTDIEKFSRGYYEFMYMWNDCNLRYKMFTKFMKMNNKDDKEEKSIDKSEASERLIDEYLEQRAEFQKWSLEAIRYVTKHLHEIIEMKNSCGTTETDSS